MKRKLIPLVTVAVVALGALIAQAGGASAHRTARHDSFFGGGLLTVVKGTVVTVNASAGTFTATVDVMDNHDHGFGLGVGGGQFFNGPGDDGDSQGWGRGFRAGDGFHGGFGGQFHGDQMTPPSTSTPTPPAPTPVTITTNSSTKFDVNGNTSATITDLAPGDRFIALFAAMPSSTSPTPSSTGTSNSMRRSRWGGDQGGTPSVPTTPALEVIAEAPPTRYAFLGTVSAVNSTASPATITVSIASICAGGSGPCSTPAGLFSGSQTFQVDPDMLSNVAVGDLVFGGEINMGGLTAAQVEASPLQFLFDLFPSSMSTSSAPSTTPATMAMAKRLVKAESFNRAIKRLRKAHRAHRSKHHAKAHHRHARA